MEKKRYANIDLLKTIAILMVIVVHSQVFNTNFISNFQISSIFQYALRIVTEGVPIFILVNGFLLINKKEFDLRKHINKTIKIFLLLILWSLILTISIKLIWKEPLNINEIIKNIFATDINNKHTGVLWFLQNLIALYLIYPILKITYDTNKKVYNYIFVVLLINTILVNMLSLISNIIETQIPFTYINVLNNYISKFQILTNRNFLIFFMLGGYLYENKEKFAEKKVRYKWIIIGIISWIIALVYAIIISKLQGKIYPDNFNYNTAFMLLIMIGIFSMTIKYQDNNRWYNKLIKCISINSLGIYFLHIIIIRLINELYTGTNTILFKISKVVITLILSLGLTLIIKKIPKAKKIVEI